MKKFKYGYTLGKFMPPHNGHLHLIREASKQCEKLTVLVCSLKDEPISGNLRYEWLLGIFHNEIFEGNILFKHIQEEVPQTPEEDENFWPIWVDLMKRNINPKTEVFFSSEKYGDDVAKYMDIKHVSIDQSRSAYNVSGTLVRSNPFKYWNFLHPVVRLYFMKRVVLVGPESTGKTTLVGKLHEHYDDSITVDEYGREYCEKHKPETLSEKDFIEIGLKQYLNDWSTRRKGVENGAKIMFCDTDILVTAVYAEMYGIDLYGRFETYISYDKPDLYLLLDVDVDFHQDGQRIYIDQNRRKEHFELFKRKLIEYNCNFEVVSSVGEQRTINAIEIINSKLNYENN